MNLCPGIDTPPPAELLIVKVNLPFDKRQKAIDILKAIEAVSREHARPGREDGLNLLVGFGLPFSSANWSSAARRRPSRTSRPGAYSSHAFPRGLG